MKEKTPSPRIETPVLDRRSLLIGSALGAATSVGTMTTADAATKSQAGHPQHAHGTSQSHTHQRQGAFLNDDDYATIIAFTERLMPGAPGKPGAKDANVANYIDLALSGAYTDQQYFYRQGLEALETYCQAQYKKSFMFLTTAQQDTVLAAMDENKAAGFTWPTAKAFFEKLRLHTIEGLFSDPVYGGNKDFAGWKLVGFPGAQPFFTEDDMKSGKPFTREPIIGMQQSQARKRKG
jgi:gluconate 2-dehydrogenase gamma chain